MTSNAYAAHPIVGAVTHQPLGRRTQVLHPGLDVEDHDDVGGVAREHFVEFGVHSRRTHRVEFLHHRLAASDDEGVPPSQVVGLRAGPVTRVLIVDDHRMFVDSLVRLLGDQTDLVVVDVANSVAEAVRAVDRHDPDVVLLDYRLPDGDAPACIAELDRLPSQARVLVMTGLGDEATLASAREAGCAGVVTKDRAARDLLEALRAVASGASLADPVTPRATPRRQPLSPGSALSAREREVLALLAAGQSTEGIAGALHISPVTVRNHVQRILSEVGCPVASRSSRRRNTSRNHRPTRAPRLPFVVVPRAAAVI